MSEELSMAALEYALGTLPADERAAFARQLAADAEARAALADWERKLAPMAAAIEPVQPDPSIFRAIEQQLGPPLVSGNVVALKTSVMRWRAAATAMSALAASLALYVTFKPAPEIVRPVQTAAVQSAPAAVAPTAPAPIVRSEGTSGITTASASRQNENLVVTANGPREASIKGGLNIQLGRDEDTSTYVAALTHASAPVALMVRADAAQNALIVRRLLASIPAGSVLRLWLVTPNAPPRALGAIADETTRLALPRDVTLAGATIAVSIEPSGAALDAPSGPFVYQGRLLRE